MNKPTTCQSRIIQRQPTQIVINSPSQCRLRRKQACSTIGDSKDKFSIMVSMFYRANTFLRIVFHCEGQYSVLSHKCIYQDFTFWSSACTALVTFLKNNNEERMVVGSEPRSNWSWGLYAKEVLVLALKISRVLSIKYKTTKMIPTK